MLMDSSGNIGIKTFTPVATLDVNGTMKLTKYTAQPMACSTASDALVAATSKYTTCICNGSSALWVKTADGTSACVW